jgi:hypothetical protein
LVAAWLRGGGSGSAKRGGSAQCDGGSAVAAVPRLQWLQQQDVGGSMAVVLHWRQRQRQWRQREAWRLQTA